jgi:hypothetical protein
MNPLIALFAAAEHTPDLGLCLFLSGRDKALEFLEPVQHKVDLRGRLLRLNRLDHQESLAILADIVGYVLSLE